jgi:hypothetical protein
LGIATKADVTRAYEAGFADGGEDEPPSGELKKFGYRRSSAGVVRDFGGLDYDQVLDTAWRVFLLSPLARRALQIKRDYICGAGLAPKTDDEALQVILDDFWKANKLDARTKQFVMQRHLFGEQIFPAFVRETDGRVRIGYIDPVQVEKVIQHPENALEAWAVLLKNESAAVDEPWRKNPDARQLYRIIREDEGVVEKVDLDNGLGEVTQSEYEGKYVTAEQATLQAWEEKMLTQYKLTEYTGSVFYFPLNNLSNQPRGYTDLLQVVDWIDQDETVLFDLADREAMAGYFFADVTLTGANDAKVRERSKALRNSPPKKGSLRVHNEMETWNLAAPDLKQPASVESHHAIETHAWGGMGLPNSWYGRGDETNRATAQAQGDPTWKTMETEQDADRAMFVEMLMFARDQAAIAGVWKSTKQETKVDVLVPEMTARDTVAITAAASQLAMALQMAVDAGWMTQQNAIDAWSKVMAELDIDIDTKKVGAEVAAQADQDDLDVQQGRNDWYAQYLPGDEPIAVDIGNSGADA